MNPYPWLRRIAGLALLLAASVGTAGETRSQFTLAVVPQFRPEEIHRAWMPVVERVQADTGITLKLTVAANIPDFESSLLSGEPDFAYMNPYHQVMAMRAQGYLPLVRDSKPLTGILVVRRDDPVASVKELDGKEVAFPAPNAFGASLWMRALLAERDKIRIVPIYLKTHSNAFRHVATGRVAAAGGVNNTLIEEPAELQAVLRVLMETPGVPPHPLSANPRVPQSVRRAVTDAFLAVASTTEGQRLLAAIPMPSPVHADYRRDYAPLERYGLDKYVVHPSKP